jgi:hypothetical protein
VGSLTRRRTSSHDAAGVLGGLALGVVEIGRHGNDSLGDGLAQVGFSVGPQLAQDEGRDFRRGEGALAELELDHRLAVRGDAEGKQPQFLGHVSDAAAHQALHGVDGAVRRIDE